MTEPVLCLTEQIKPQHIVGEDSLDKDDEPRKGELYMHDSYAELTNKCLIVRHNYICYVAIEMCDFEWR